MHEEFIYLIYETFLNNNIMVIDKISLEISSRF